MKFTVNVFGRKFEYDMSLEELIKEHAEIMLCYTENSYFDGDIKEMPSVEKFVEEIYNNVINGYECSIALDGTEFDMVFPDEVRFLGAEKIKGIIRSVYEVE